MKEDIQAISYDDAGFLVGRGKNTIIGYSTREKGRIYVPNNGVPYPEGMKSVIKRVMEKEKAEENLENLENLYKIITRGTSYEGFMKSISSERERLGKVESKEKSLSKKVLDTEDENPPRITEKDSEPTLYPPEVDYEEDSKTKTTEESREIRQTQYPYLTKRELNMPLNNLIEKIRVEINSLKSKNLTPEKEEELKKLEAKRRSIYPAWKDGVFNRK